MMSRLGGQQKQLLATGILLLVTLNGCGDNKSAAPISNDATKAVAVPTTERDPNRLWCTEHGVYEDECVICHPELAKKKEAPASERDPNRLWCNEHGVYEDECFICHPELKDKPKEQARNGDANSSVLMCGEHNVLEAECAICRPESLADVPVGSGLKIRFASETSTQKAGIATGTPTSASTDTAQVFLGQVSFNRNQLAEITPLSAGVVGKVFKDVGDTVQTGDELFMMRAPEVAAIASEYKKALAEARVANQTLAREQDLYKREISPRQDLELAQAAVAVQQSAIEEARQHLAGLGISKDEIDAVAKGGFTGSNVSARAPFAGTIIARNAVPGKTVATGDTLFQIADLSTMWMEFSVPENQIATVHAGTTVRARFDAFPGISFDGEVLWVAPSVDPQTRLVKARAELKNAQSLLKDGLFGSATLAGVVGEGVLAVPESAIQEVEGRPVVFRKVDADLFESRPVELGDKDNGRVVILAGLAADDQVVTQGSYLVKSEMLRARLGAGCADH